MNFPLIIGSENPKILAYKQQNDHTPPIYQKPRKPRSKSRLMKNLTGRQSTGPFSVGIETKRYSDTVWLHNIYYWDFPGKEISYKIYFELFNIGNISY